MKTSSTTIPSGAHVSTSPAPARTDLAATSPVPGRVTSGPAGPTVTTTQARRLALPLVLGALTWSVSSFALGFNPASSVRARPSRTSRGSPSRSASCRSSCSSCGPPRRAWAGAPGSCCAWSRCSSRWRWSGASPTASSPRPVTTPGWRCSTSSGRCRCSACSSSRIKIAFAGRWRGLARRSAARRRELGGRVGALGRHRRGHPRAVRRREPPARRLRHPGPAHHGPTPARGRSRLSRSDRGRRGENTPCGDAPARRVLRSRRVGRSARQPVRSRRSATWRDTAGSRPSPRAR